MDRAQFYLWSAKHGGSGEFADLPEVASKWSIGDRLLRKADMEAAIAAWAGRTDLPDSKTYVASLRNVQRKYKLVSA